MTLEEKLELPAGYELDKVIAEHVFGWKWVDYRGYDTGEKQGWRTQYSSFAPSFSHVASVGWDYFWKWLHKRGGCIIIAPQMGGNFTASLGGDEKAYFAETALLAAWRAALAWHHRKESS